MKKIALLADIHGNYTALTKVLEDIENQGGVDSYWILGDLVAFGPEPVKVLEKLSELPNVLIVRGNTDRYVFTDDRPSIEENIDEDIKKQRFNTLHGSFCWAQGTLCASGWFDWLRELPIKRYAFLLDNTKVLLIHGAPESDDFPIWPNTDLNELRFESGVNLICVGHTHWPINMWHNNIHIYNPGSIGNPIIGRPNASYAILFSEEDGYKIRLREVKYDYEKVISLLKKYNHPGARFVIALLKGHIRPDPIKDLNHDLS